MTDKPKISESFSSGSAEHSEVKLKEVPTTVTDLDGNVYHTVPIGNQLWMVENLKTSKYRDGSPISIVPDIKKWSDLTAGACCWYDNDPENRNTYGALYNHYAVMDNRKLSPTDWHVPANDEWITLINYLGGEIIASGKLKESGTAHWCSPNVGFTDVPGINIIATNDSNFTAIPGGLLNENGIFRYIREYGYWWNSSEYSNENALFMFMNSNYAFVSSGYRNKRFGFSVRCIWNETL